MTPPELQQAIAQFESAGGQVQVVADAVRAYQDPALSVVPPVDVELVEAIRGYTEAGVCAAAKALGKSTRTINYIAGLYGIKFATTTDATLEDRRKEEAKLVPRIRRLAKANMSQVTIAEQVGVSRMTLRRIARFHGITLNSRAS
jgi:DNA-binding MurR/RpiR family transcriptional regulator